MVYLSMLLANLLCAYTPCFPKFEPPLPSEVQLGTRHGILPDANRTKWPVISTQIGNVQGFAMKTIGGRDIYAFEGIPFAEPPVGALRFRNPVPKRPSSGKINVQSTIGKNCIQTDLSRFFSVTGDEDCLYLNVYTPEVDESSSLPVMIWFYGGAYLFGSKDQYGPAYLLDRDVVLVTVNYRLGAFGFLSTGDEVSPGNYGLKDQHLALQWVRDNIRVFGGDPEKITLVGQSAGGASVHFHMLSKLSRGKFIRAISQSASAFCSWGVVRDVEASGIKLAKALRCPSDNSTNMIHCLRSVDPNILAVAQNKLYEWLNYPAVNFGPTVEKYQDKESFLTKTPEEHYAIGDVAKVPWVVGFVPNEGNVYNIVMMLLPAGYWYFDRNFDRLAPLTLDYRGRGLDLAEVTKKIRTFYFGDQALTYQNLQRQADMYGDRYLMTGIYRGIMEHSRIAPTYGYFFNYTGEFSILQQTGMTREEAGIAHYDDVRYLFNSSQLHKSISLGHPDAAMSEFMVDLWTNFATGGEPLHTDETGEEIRVWYPIDPDNIKLLAITEHPKQIPFPESYLERIRFWNKLNISH